MKYRALKHGDKVYSISIHVTRLERSALLSKDHNTPSNSPLQPVHKRSFQDSRA